MRYKIPILFTLVLAFALFTNISEAAKRFDTDVGGKTYAKAKSGDHQPIPTFQMFTAAYEAAPALVRNKFVTDIYLEPKKNRDWMIWNDRIDHNFPFQLPCKAGPPIIYSRRE